MRYEAARGIEREAKEKRVMGAAAVLQGRQPAPYSARIVLGLECADFQGEGSMMQRSSFEHDGLTLSYLDTGGDRPLIIALHAMWMEARSFEAFAIAMPGWRVVSLDQRGHGLSDHSSDYSRAAFIGDIAALLDHLGVREPVVIIGNSLGGTNAFIFAATHPGRVRAMVIEEGPPEQKETLSFVLDWRGVYPTSEALEQKIGKRLAWSVKPSFRETAQGWTLAFDPDELVSMKEVLNGDFWGEWLGTTCPAMVVRGTTSKAVDGKLLETMAARRPNTELVTLETGHVTHHDDLAGFVSHVRAFLEKLR
jgi:esterase